MELPGDKPKGHLTQKPYKPCKLPKLLCPETVPGAKGAASAPRVRSSGPGERRAQLGLCGFRAFELQGFTGYFCVCYCGFFGLRLTSRFEE